MIEWQSISTLPYNFCYGQAVVYNGEIHIMGTANSNVSTYKTNHYKFDGTNWSEVSTLPYNFYYGQAVVYNGEIHIMGTMYNKDYMTAHYKFDGVNWSEVSTLPYGLVGGRAVVLNNEIHLLGGSNNDGGSNLTNHYKFDGTNWSEVSTLPYDFRAGCAVVLNNEIHILGYGGSTDNSTKHYKFDGTNWSEVSTLPCAVMNASAVVFDDTIHVVCSRENKHYMFDGTKWWKATELPYTYYGGDAVVLGDDLHVLGGNNSDTKHYAINLLNEREEMTMSNVQKKSILTTQIAGVLTDLMVKTTADQVYIDETTTLASKLAEVITALNGKAASQHTHATADVTGLDDALTARPTTTAMNEAISTAISELIDGAPETYDTLKEIADYITSHQDVVDALNAAIGSKADASVVTALQTTVDAIKATVDGLGALATKDRVAKEDLDDTLSGTVDSLTAHAANTTVHITDAERTAWNAASAATAAAPQIYYSATQPETLKDGDIWVQLLD